MQATGLWPAQPHHGVGTPPAGDGRRRDLRIRLRAPDLPRAARRCRFFRHERRRAGRSSERRTASGCHAGCSPTTSPTPPPNPRTATLPFTTSAGIGAYLGVPVFLSDGSLFGSFACFHHEPHELGDRDVRFMRMLGELVTAELETMRERDEATDPHRPADRSAALDIALQPVFDVHDGRFLGAEALARFPRRSARRKSVFESAAAVGSACRSNGSPSAARSGPGR